MKGDAGPGRKAGRGRAPVSLLVNPSIPLIEETIGPPSKTHKRIILVESFYGITQLIKHKTIKT